MKVLYNDSNNKVLPSALRLGLFKIFVDDNLDKNCSSVNAKANFHGTAITVLQYPTIDNPGLKRSRKRFSELNSIEQIQSCDSLKTFTTINHVDKIDFRYSVETVNIPDAYSKANFDNLKLRELKNEDEWLRTTLDVNSDPTSWTAHHEKQLRDSSENITTINVPLPLIDHKANALELQYHVMKTSMEYTQYLIPGQVTVCVSDQPLFALKRSIQLARPDEFRNYFCFMGGLHIEQAALVCLGQLITGTGLDDIISKTSLDTVGLKTAVCDVNNIKKARYTLQVIAVALTKKTK